MDNQEETSNKAEIDQSYLDVNLEINDNVRHYQFEPLPRARSQPQPQGQRGGSGTSSSEESEGGEDVNKDRIRNTNC